MYKARQYLDEKAPLNLYYSYIYPYFIYCIEVWGNASHCHLHPLFLLQKQIIRIMTFSPYLANTETLFINLFLKGRFYFKINNIYTTYKIYTYRYIPPPATYANTIHNAKQIDIKHLSNGQLSRKVVQLIYMGCPKLMQIY